MKTKSLRCSLFFWLCLVALCTSCIGPHYHEHPLVLFGKAPPKLSGANDPAIITNLTTHPWHKSLIGSETGIGAVWFKSMGINGWKDYHLQAKAESPVVMHQIASSGFLTVDLRLNYLTIGGVLIPINEPRYMRLEIYLGHVAVDKAIRHETNEIISAEGKLAWDSDGWFEIHPQKTGDVQLP
jgi:hypothetical protein